MGFSESGVYIPITISIALFLISWVYSGLEGLSSILLMVSIYSLFVPSLFFTFGAFIEQLIVKKQIDRVTEEIKQVPEAVGYDIPDINIPPADPSEDEKVIKSNQDLMTQAFLILVSFFIAGAGLSYIAWNSSEKRIPYKHIIVSNLLLLGLVSLIEILFFGLITLNYRSLDSNMVVRTSLKTIGEKMKNTD
jgi:hypothetical protein